MRYYQAQEIEARPHYVGKIRKSRSEQMRTSLEIVIHVRKELRDLAEARDTGAAKVINERVTEICEALSDWLVAEHRNSLEIVDRVRELLHEMSLSFPVGNDFRDSYETSKELGRLATRLASWLEAKTDDFDSWARKEASK